MELHGEGLKFFMPHALQGLVIEVQMGYFYFFLIQGINVHAETVILYSHRDFAGL